MRNIEGGNNVSEQLNIATVQSKLTSEESLMMTKVEIEHLIFELFERIVIFTEATPSFDLVNYNGK